MKVLTLKQPWATFIALGLKKYEFRSWKTNYRGKLLIHAGLGADKTAMKKYKYLGLEYLRSKILAEVELIDCIKLTNEINKQILSENNICYGSDYKEGYAWKLGNIQQIKYPKNIKGHLGLWNIEL